MAEPIKGRKSGDPITAPTPQNTPLNNAPISSHAQQPGVTSIKEEDIDKAAAATMLASNPQFMSMIEGKLGTLIGRSSGYIENLPVSVRRRVSGLKALQQSHAKLEAKFQERILELEKEFFQQYTPLYERRAKIVNGALEPTEEEVELGEKKDENEEGEETATKPTETAASTDEGAGTKGIPEFWLSAMKNQVSLAELITTRDELALKTLSDIRMEYLDRPGFRLIFVFGPNDFFTNETLSKTYFYQEDIGYGGDFIYDHAEGQKIDWKSGQDLTVKFESKKQRNKNTQQTRVIKKTVPTNSFFNFFNPPQPPAKGDDASVSSDIEERLELDYQLGEDIKEKLIPRAIDWFTGEALQFEEVDELDEDDYEDDEDDEDEDGSDDRDEDDETDEEDDGSKPKQETAECKQS